MPGDAGLSVRETISFSGTMDAGNIRDRIEKPMPLLKKRSLVNRIVAVSYTHLDVYKRQATPLPSQQAQQDIKYKTCHKHPDRFCACLLSESIP